MINNTLNEIKNNAPCAPKTKLDCESISNQMEVETEEQRCSTDKKVASVGDNMQVDVRFRPLLGEEVGSHKPIEIGKKDLGERFDLSIGYESNRPVRRSMKEMLRAKRKGIKLEPLSGLMKWKGAGFSNVFSEENDNLSVYQRSVEPHMNHIFNGKIVNCFAYGQTGSGKTHTQLGYDKEKGLFALAAQDMEKHLAKVNEESRGPEVIIGVQMFEMHYKKAYDLLDGRKECFIRENESGYVDYSCQVRQEAEGFYVPGTIKIAECRTAAEVEAAVKAGADMRRVGVSNVHEQSSRSHAFIVMSLRSKRVLEAEERVRICDGAVAYYDHKSIVAMRNKWRKQWTKATKELREARKEAKMNKAIGGKLIFVDLAGSEYGFDGENKTQTPEEKREARAINYSLMSLNECFRAQHEGAKRIPYRQSPLTMVMKEFIEPTDSRTVMLVACSPSQQHVSRTLATLRYANLVAKRDLHE